MLPRDWLAAEDARAAYVRTFDAMNTLDVWTSAKQVENSLLSSSAPTLLEQQRTLEDFAAVPVGTLLLELATPRAGEIDVLKELPREYRIGVGVVNQKREAVETAEEIAVRPRRAVELFGADRVWLTPDCGFATFGDNPVASARTAEAKLRAIAGAAALLHRG